MGALGNSQEPGTLKGPWGSMELNHQCSRESCGPGEFWGENHEGFGEVYTEHLGGTRSFLGALGEGDFDKVVEGSRP